MNEAHLPALLAQLGFHPTGLLLVQYKHNYAVLTRLVVLLQQLINALISLVGLDHLHHLQTT